MERCSVRAYFRDEDGRENSIETRINLSPEEARRYYLGKKFNLGPRYENGKMFDDWMMTCYKVEIIR